MQGMIIWYSKQRAYGFLEDEQGNHRYFQYTFSRGQWSPQPGRFVEFQPSESSRGRQARQLRPINGVNFARGGKNFLKEISNWKLEARFDDVERYYFHIVDVQSIEDKSKCYVIGRKGTGKTAISEYLLQSVSDTRYADKLTFKNFPFNALYSLQNNAYTAPNQYITLWKYVIYSSIAQMMSQNPMVSDGARDALANLYAGDISRTLPRKISRWTSSNFSLQVLGTGIELGISRDLEANNTSWIERVEVLEDFIHENIDEAEYFVIFDELDEDYRDVVLGGEHNQYIALLTSLFKAVQDVRFIFSNARYKVFPIVFLRDDIYDLITDSDKTKWSDFMLELDWDVSSIRKLLAFRLSKALAPSDDVLSFQDAWYSFFEPALVGTYKRQTVFSYITNGTHIRPRDYVKYLSACATEALNNDSDYVTPAMVRRVDKAFSNYLRSELEDEIFGILPNIKQVLDLIAHMRKQIFTLDEFEKAYNSQLLTSTSKSADEVIRLLFHFSVIGNQTGNRKVVFRYKNKEARVNLKEPLCVHRGLYKSLQLI